jgi:tetratricopeptide (TPR) repeat protein
MNKMSITCFFKNHKILMILFFVTITSSLARSQSDSASLAFEKSNLARESFENDRPNESLKYMLEAHRLDPNNIIYTFESGYLQYLLKDYKGAIQTMAPHIQHNDAMPPFFQFLANAYFMNQQVEESLTLLDIGLSKFPKNGMLHLEKGNILAEKKEPGQALFYFLKGIEAEPNFALNYYKAAMIHFQQNQIADGLLMGETFMNLERDSPYTEYMSAELYKQINNGLQIDNSGQWISHWCHAQKVDPSITRETVIAHPPFCQAYAYLSQNCDQTKIFQIDLSSISTIRENILELYYLADMQNIYGEPIFQFQRAIFEQGHFEAYNHWLLMIGNPEEYELWKESNTEKWSAFVQWFNRFQLQFPENE